MEKYNLTQTGQEVQDILDNAIPQSDLESEVERAQEAEQTLQGNIDAEATRAQDAEGTLQYNIDAEETRAKAAEKQNTDDIDAIEEKIPSAASSENQLADKSFVNSSISTATATFRGTFNLVSDLHLTLDATEQQIATALALAIDTADNNDYCFLQVPTSVDTPTVIGSVDRYKFNGSSWAYEYTLNNSGYTQVQWNAINSGITSGDVTKLEALPSNAQLTTLLNGKQNVLTFDNVPTEGSDNPVKSSGVFNSIEAILALIPSAASVVNQLADKAFVNSSIATATATFRGTYNLVTDLDLTISATYSDIASALADVVSGADNNDYAFVQIPTSDATPTQIAKTVRFKFNGTSWEYEYDLNNSGYTAVQWAAINSGITAALVAKLNGLPTADALQLALNAITQDIDNLEAVVPTEATSSNQLADKAFVLNEILLATPAFKGQFTTLTQLQAVTGAKTGDMGIVRTKDHDGKDVFTFYQYKDDQWNEFYTLAYHPQNKPATTGIIGSYPFNGMGRIELPMNLVDGWPNDTWLYLPVNGVVYLLYSWNLQLYAVYNSGSQEGLGLENNIVIEPANYNIADIAELVGSRYLSYTEAGGVFTITKPDTTTITSTVLNNTTIYKEDDTDHHGINLLTQSMLNKTNTIYVIQYNFTLGEDITIPENCVLEFEGGFLDGDGNTITGTNTSILANKTAIFDNIHIAGTWSVADVFSAWFKDNTATDVLKELLNFTDDNTFNNVYIDDREYSVSTEYGFSGCLVPTSNTKLEINGTINLESNSYSDYAIIGIVGKENITVCGSGSIIGDSDTHTGTSGDWGMGICISNSTNIVIQSLNISKCWGDSVYIVGTNPSSGIVLQNINLHHSRRQGISIIHANNTIIENCHIHHIAGTQPEACIDIEPNADCMAINTIIRNCIFENSLRGISINGNATNAVVRGVEITNCVISCTSPLYTKKVECLNIKNVNTESPSTGVILLSTKNVMMQGCKILITTDSSSVYSFSIDADCEDIIIDSCVGRNSFDVNAPVLFANCTFDNWYSGATVGVVFDNCKFTNVYQSKAQLNVKECRNCEFTLKGAEPYLIGLFSNCTFIKDTTSGGYVLQLRDCHLKRCTIVLKISCYCLFHVRANISMEDITILTSASITGGFVNIDANKVLTAKTIKYDASSTGSVDIFNIEGSGIISYDQSDLYSKKGTIRPSLPGTNRVDVMGFEFYDESLRMPIYWRGTYWTDAKGYTPTPSHGTVRPTSIGEGGVLVDSRDKGHEFFDETLGKPIYVASVNDATGPVVWVDATGATV